MCGRLFLYGLVFIIYLQKKFFYSRFFHKFAHVYFKHVSAYRLQFSKEAINVNWGSRHEGYYIRAVHK